MQFNKIAAGFSAALITAMLMSGTAEASCRDTDTCPQHQVAKKTQATKKKMKWAQVRVHKPKHVKVASRKLSSKRMRSQSALAAIPHGRSNVVAMIKSQAPRYGVPIWFALRIAQVESGYNPRARGSAGEIGVFQLKCQTARGLGYHGNCGGLYNAATNVQFGLKHLGLAVRSSRGNLKLAASKHNGGLGRKRLVPRYVAMVF